MGVEALFIGVYNHMAKIYLVGKPSVVLTQEQYAKLKVKELEVVGATKPQNKNKRVKVHNVEDNT
jgi:hypothetical protein